MNRRGFFSLLAGVAATAVLDPERLLWVPGKKLISIPKLVSDAEMEEFAERYLRPAAKALADKIDAQLLGFYDASIGGSAYRFRMYAGGGSDLVAQRGLWPIVRPLCSYHWTMQPLGAAGG